MKKAALPVNVLLAAAVSAAVCCTAFASDSAPDSVPSAAEPVMSSAEVVAEKDVPADPDAAWLREYFNVQFDGEVTAYSFNNALTDMGGEAVEADPFTLADAVTGAVRLAGMEELALTYESDAAMQKAEEILRDNNISAEEAYEPYIACALDLGLADSSWDFDGGISASQATAMLAKAAGLNGTGRHYIGRISDPDILEKICTVLSETIIFDNEELTDLGDQLVLDGAVTGYGLKYSGSDARFLEENTLKYSHSELRHAEQLIGLLKSEGFDGYVQIEPKLSVYEYMADWGDPGDPTPTYAVIEVEENRMLAYAVEYDLMIEFENTDEKESFHGLIEDYAKKYDSSFDEDGNLTAKLLDGSWWQPLYSSVTEMENEEYVRLTDNIVYNSAGDYSIHTFTLPENAAAVAEAVGEIAPDLTAGEKTIYVNPAFYRYISGEDYQ